MTSEKWVTFFPLLLGAYFVLCLLAEIAGEVPAPTSTTERTPMEQKHVTLKLEPMPGIDERAYRIVLAEDAKAGDILPAVAVNEGQLPFRGTRACVGTAVTVEIPLELRQ